MHRHTDPKDDADRSQRDAYPNQDVADRVARFDAVNLFHSPDLVEGYLRFRQLALHLMAQYEAGIGDFANPASQLGSVKEAHFD